jgi:hypothetical protein
MKTNLCFPTHRHAARRLDKPVSLLKQKQKNPVNLIEYPNTELIYKYVQMFQQIFM